LPWFTFVGPVSGLVKYLKKLIRNTDIEDSLETLDKLTQEEVRMAFAEHLRIAHSVEGKVEDVNDKVQDVDNKVKELDDGVKDVGDKVQGIDRKLDDTNHSSSLVAHALLPSERSSLFTGNLLRDSLLRWLSPSDPSINHNIASKAHHDGTAQWFFQGRIFKQWKSTGSFLWVHGKRVFLLTSTLRHQS
jgi:uncharacterized protein YoxC